MIYGDGGDGGDDGDGGDGDGNSCDVIASSSSVCDGGDGGDSCDGDLEKKQKHTKANKNTHK